VTEVMKGDNIRMVLHEVGFWGMDWIELAQDRYRDRHFYCNIEPSCSIK